MSRKKREFESASETNTRTFLYYFNKIKQIAISSFKWDGLPEFMNERFMETTLFNKAAVAVFEDEDISQEPVALPLIAWAGIDLIGDPKYWTGESLNGYISRRLNKDNSVPIWNNMLRQSELNTANIFAKKLYLIDRVIDINVNAQKTPVLITSTETQRLTMKNLYMQYDGNYPFIFGDKNMDFDQIKALKTDAPYIADRLFELKTKVWNEVMSVYGVTSTTIQKKERMIKDEVAQANAGSISNRFSRLQTRKEAAEKINAMFGTNITVEYRLDTVPEADPMREDLEDE